ncbi:MAG: Molybdenum transport ATP-binding protein ModC, partial [uncultured Gemmatimonadetes bacterium]
AGRPRGAPAPWLHPGRGLPGARRGARPLRPLRRGEVHDAAPGGRPGPPRRRGDPPGRARAGVARAAGVGAAARAPLRPGLPGLRPLPPPHRRRQRALRGALGRGARAPSAPPGLLPRRPPGLPLPQRALRRRNAAGGPGPRPHGRARGPPPRRALLLPRRDGPPHRPGRGAGRARRVAHPLRLRHPRPGRGRAPGRPHPVHARRDAGGGGRAL